MIRFQIFVKNVLGYKVQFNQINASKYALDKLDTVQEAISAYISLKKHKNPKISLKVSQKLKKSLMLELAFGFVQNCHKLNVAK